MTAEANGSDALMHTALVQARQMRERRRQRLELALQAQVDGPEEARLDDHEVERVRTERAALVAQVAEIDRRLGEAGSPAGEDSAGGIAEPETPDAA